MTARSKSNMPRAARGMFVVGAFVAAWGACSSTFTALRFVASGLTSSSTSFSQQMHGMLAAPHVGRRMLGQQRKAIVETSSASYDGFDLTGKVALVTGASRGIGAAIAQRLAEAGATVVGTATSDVGVKAIDGRFSGGGGGKGLKLDVVDPVSVEAVLQDVQNFYGGVDILVNNAGITQDALMMRMTEKHWDAVIDTNLNSVFRMTKAVLKCMTKRRWGRIISISSVVGSMGNPGQANYAAAKAGMDGFTRAVAREVGGRSITVNSVAPGFMKTDMTDVLKEEHKAKLLEAVPVGRLGTPKEIADAVLFLASPSAGYITGHTLHVNGGMHM